MRADLLGRLLLRSIVGYQSIALIGRPPPLRSVGAGDKRTGTTPMAEAARIAGLNAVGRYALGVDWAASHDSLFPYRTLRLACPCDVCAAEPPETRRLAPGAEELRTVEVLGERSIFLG